ncbi:MAG: EAL domain-containing protein [Methylococcaceae bacterium]
MIITPCDDVTELEDLRARLAETEETLHAIFSGEVDALVVKKEDGENQVFTLENSYYSYRVLVEEMREGAVIATEQGVVLYSNRAFSEFVKTPLEQVIGSFIFDWFTPDCKNVIVGVLSSDTEKKYAELSLIARDGTTVFVHISVSPQTTEHRFCMIATDLTEINERKQKEMDALLLAVNLERERDAESLEAQNLLRQSNDLDLHNQILKKVGLKTFDLQALHELLDELIQKIESLYPEKLCSIFLLNNMTGELRCGAAPIYDNTIDDLMVRDDVDPCAVSAFRGEQVIIQDVLAHPHWTTFCKSMKSANLRSCWVQPIQNSQNETLGVIAIYNREPRSPTESQLVSVEQYANLILLIIERYRDHCKIQQLAFYDPLTGLANRRLMLERLRSGIEYCHRENKTLAVLMMDLDKFKAVNDTFGHGAGDELLQKVAMCLQERLRKVDTVARLGGDEFIVLLQDIAHVDDAARVAELIINDVSQPLKLSSGNLVQIGMSVGISLFPHHGDTPELLIDQADTALYHAKDSGRGRVAYFSGELTEKIHKRITLENRLRRAITNHELRLYYQPQVEILTGKIIGTEALIRWLDPEKGLILPSDFIPLAEETGLIEAIGEWVVYEACRQGKIWMDLGITELTIAVNVSSIQFRRCDLNELVKNALRETGFPAERLELELTESGLMENQEKVVDVLNHLRTQGICLAIDDFGTGYSSLAYLKRFPLDVLKIDKSFIDDIPKVKDDMAITATIIAMGHTLGFKVLAEGVETPEQLAFLEEKGCDIYQGYIKSRPLPADDFLKLLQTELKLR